MSLQADLFRTESPEPAQGVWYIARFVSWSYMTSPTRGEMRRLVGEIVDGPCMDWVIWKPLTVDLTGIRWAERSLRKAGFPAEKLASLRRRGLGEYLDELLRALVGRGRLQVTVYPFHWRQPNGASEIFYTVDKVRRA